MATGNMVACFMLLDDDSVLGLHDEDFSNQRLPLFAAALLRSNLPRIENYVEVVVPRYSPDAFKTFFRVSRETFEIICRNVGQYPELSRRQPNAGRPQLALDKSVLIFMWYMGCQETVRSIADRFDISLGTFVRTIRKLLDIFDTHLKQKFIVWPSQIQHRVIADNFQQKRGFPSVLGAIDGTHIAIRAPKDHKADYLNRKKFHSIILQAVCRENREFVDINVGWPGRVHDARVFRNSKLCDEGRGRCGQYHILGDGAYPCIGWLLTPYRDNGQLDQASRKYNSSLSATRVIIENAFGILKGRFRRLKFIDMADISYMCKVCVAACILHNACILEGDELEEAFEADQPMPDNLPGLVFRNDAEGPAKRQRITRQLANN